MARRHTARWSYDLVVSAAELATLVGLIDGGTYDDQPKEREWLLHRAAVVSRAIRKELGPKQMNILAKDADIGYGLTRRTA